MCLGELPFYSRKNTHFGRLPTKNQLCIQTDCFHPISIKFLARNCSNLNAGTKYRSTISISRNIQLFVGNFGWLNDGFLKLALFVEAFFQNLKIKFIRRRWRWFVGLLIKRILITFINLIDLL